jgi:tRNA-dihydrouridine synthase B
MGCTAQKVVRRGEGVSLMKHELQASEVVTAVVDAVEVPVTCKLRLGVSKQSINVISLSQKLIDAGAVTLTIHGRSGEKKFGSRVDLDIIKKATTALSAPIIANGGIYTGLDAQKILKETGAIAVMPGRGLLGNPWIVPEILNTLSKHSYTPPRLQQKKDICIEHLRLLTEFYGERRAVLKMRSILPHYFSSCLFLKDLKKDVQQVTDVKYIPILLERIENDGIKTVYRTETFH